MTHTLSAEAIFRIVRSNFAAELRALRPNDPRVTPATKLEQTTSVKDGPLGLDSLEFMTLATSVAAQFNLFETDIQDSLLRHRTLQGWCDVLRASPVAAHEALSFASSGTMGNAKRLRHPLAWLQQEIATWSATLPPIKRIVSLCPVHHIYGCIWGVLLPAALAAPAVDFALDEIVPGCFAPGDLIVATPPVWRMLAMMGYRFADGVYGVTSTSPMPDDIATMLTENRLTALYQIYGSTETAGVAFRTAPNAPYTLMPFWRKPHEETHTGSLVRDCIDGQARIFPTLDRLEWLDATHFYVRGRRDQAVQIGGHNVSLQWVEAQLAQHENVEAASVRTFATDENAIRLKAFIVLRSDHEQARHDFAFWLQQSLPAHARPRALRFGETLPVNAMGKPCDWSLETGPS